MRWFTDFFWPTLERPTAAETQEDARSETADIQAVSAQIWMPNGDLALEEARRLADSEEDRRRTAENKATTYLLFASAFAAALVPFLPSILEGKTGPAPGWLVAIILILAVSYLVAAGIWAFRTLRVATYQRLDVPELVRMWNEDDPKSALIRETFAVARRNYAAVNRKVTYIKMTHEFIARSFIAFGILIVVEAGWVAIDSAIARHPTHLKSEAIAD